MVQIPSDLKFSKTHEWVKVDGDTVTVGVSDFAQSELGDITYIELPEPGTQLTQNEPLGVIESVKAASDIYSPVSGEVLEANDEPVNAPDLVNSSPYERAWLIRVRLSDTAQLGNLMDATAYEQFVEQQGGAH